MASKAVIDTLIAEAGGEGEEGLIAAAWAIQQRAAARGVSIDRVVRSGFDGFTSPGSGAVKAQNDPALRARVEQIVSGVESGSIPNPVPGADHFLSGDVMPNWAKGMKLVATVGGHRFYASGNVPEDKQGGSVATKLDTARQAPTPVAQSPQIAARRNPQNMTPAADLANTDRSVAASYLKKDNSGVDSPIDIVLGRQMTTGLPQTPGQSRIERAPVATRTVPGVSQIERSPAPKPAPGQSQIERNPAAAPKPAPRMDGVGKMPAFGDVTMLKNAGGPGPASMPKSQDRLHTADLTISTQRPVIQTAAQVEAASGFRLGKGSALTTTTKEVANPAYARLMERVKQGEMSLNGLSRDSVDQRAKGLAAVEKMKAQIATMNKTIQIRNEARQQQAVSVTRSAPTSTPAVVPRAMSVVDQYRSQGMTPSQAYDAANNAAVERAIAGARDPAAARRLNERG